MCPSKDWNIQHKFACSLPFLFGGPIFFSKALVSWMGDDLEIAPPPIHPLVVGPFPHELHGYWVKLWRAAGGVPIQSCQNERSFIQLDGVVSNWLPGYQRLTSPFPPEWRKCWKEFLYFLVSLQILEHPKVWELIIPNLWGESNQEVGWKRSLSPAWFLDLKGTRRCKK